MAMQRVSEQSFESSLTLEGSWGSRSLGKHMFTLDLQVDAEALTGFIQWDIPAIEETEHVGLWFEKTEDDKLGLIDYDGVFSLPREAIQMMREAGIVVSPEFE